MKQVHRILLGRWSTCPSAAACSLSSAIEPSKTAPRRRRADRLRRARRDRRNSRRARGRPQHRPPRLRLSVIPAQTLGCPGKGLRLGPAVWLAFNTAAPRRPIAVNPPWRHKCTRETISARAAPWRVLRLRSAPLGDGDRSAWLLATKRFCCRNRPFGRFGQQNGLVAKGHRGGRGSRLAKRSGATGEAGLALRRARLDGTAVFGICFLERARF